MKKRTTKSLSVLTLSVLLAAVLAGQAVVAGAEEFTLPAEEPAQEIMEDVLTDDAFAVIGEEEEPAGGEAFFEDDFILAEEEAFDAEEEFSDTDAAVEQEPAGEAAEETPEDAEAGEEENALFDGEEDLFLELSAEETVDVSEDPAGDVTWNCGTNLKAILSDDGTLTIKPNAAGCVMDDYSGSSPPWAFSTDDIKKVVIDNSDATNKVTNIGPCAFEQCTNLAEIVFQGEGLTKIGDHAFQRCSAIETVTFPASLTEIGESAFLDCEGISRVTVPDTVTTIGSYAFGYRFITDTMTYEKVESFLMDTGNGTAADTYAITNGFKIDLSAATVTVPKASYPYTGSAIKPAPTVVSGKETLKSGTDYTVAYTNNKDLGTATITVTGKGVCTGTKTVTFKIIAKAYKSSEIEVKLAYTSVVYNGSAKKPAIKSVTAGGKTMYAGGDYTATYADGRIDPGTYKVTIKLKGNYSGTKTVSFKILPKSIKSGDIKVKLAYTSTWYNGKNRKPAIKSVKIGSTTLTDDDYTVTYPSGGSANVGTYKVSVKLRGIYSGSTTCTYKVRPKRNTVKSVTALAGGFKVVWTKHKKQTSGYIVQYSRTADFSNNTETVVVAGKTKNNLVVTDLLSGKNYYVRVRTYMDVNGVRYRSTWAPAMKVTTK